MRWVPSRIASRICCFSAGLAYVAMGSTFHGPELAHEMGHYLHLAHTHPGLRPRVAKSLFQAMVGSNARGKTTLFVVSQ